MLIYILVIYIYRTYAMPTTTSSDIHTPPSSPNSSPVTPFIHSLVHILPRSTSGQNMCSTSERGLFDIVWSCIVTMFACIYKALHPNVPSQELGWRGRLWIKIKLSLYMLIAPELVAFWAAIQWCGARKIAREMNKIDKEIKWTTVHGHFVQMLALGRKDDGKPYIWKWSDIPSNSFKSPTEREEQGKRLSLKYLYSEGYIELDSLRSIKEEDIMDRSKGDLLSKLFAILQTSWFILGCVARHHKRLPLTELEVITLASAVINSILYILWWNKPQGVERRQYLTNILTKPGAKPEPSSIEASSLRMRIYRWYYSFTKNILQFIRQLREISIPQVYSKLPPDTNTEPTEEWHFRKFLSSFLGPIGRDVIRTVDDISLSCNAQFFAVDVTEEDGKSLFGLAFVFTAAFSAVHFIAWNFAFPSRVEFILWRVSCLILLVAPTVPLTLLMIYFILENDFVFRMGEIISVLSIPLYIFARLCVVVLAFVTLRDPDPQIFVNIPWTCYIPHL